jgi:uncharacterized protein
MTPTRVYGRAAVPTVTSPRRDRVTALDALRGFALCGILLVNIPWQMVTIEMPWGPPSGGRYFAVDALLLLVHGRFFPIFSFLFGVGFALFLDTAAARSSHPRLVLLRRLVVLGALGAAHQLLQPGEALTPYAIIGVLVLLPTSWLSRHFVLAAAGIALAAGVWLGGGMLVIPALFLLGSAAVRYGVIETLGRRRRQIAVLFAVSAVAAVATTVWQAATVASANAEQIEAIAGLIGAVAYSTGLLLILGTRPGAALERNLAPLGRMALTNYLTATVLAVVAGPLLGLSHSAHYGRMLALALAILTVQVVFSRYWLNHFRYGPLEWIWRCLTWWTRTTNRRSAV